MADDGRLVPAADPAATPLVPGHACIGLEGGSRLLPGRLELLPALAADVEGAADDGLLVVEPGTGGARPAVMSRPSARALGSAEARFNCRSSSDTRDCREDICSGGSCGDGQVGEAVHW